MVGRDDFTAATKRYVALRAGYRCSFRGCPQITVGPSDEAPTGVTNIGKAAHICAASAGGRRYVSSMTPEERAHIDNAIWMCANHADLIDRDEVLYTIEHLRQMKRDHEAACARDVQQPTRSPGTYGLIAIGSDIVCRGEILEVDKSEWSIHLRNFVSGDFNALLGFVDKFSNISPNQYILLNEIGDGRVLTEAPSLSKSDVGYRIKCAVAPRFPRVSAQDLGSEWAISPTTNDLFIENGQIARVSGLAALPQRVRSCLSMQRGESFFNRDYGVRFAEYFEAFRGSPWLGHFLMLEVVRQAAIPYRQEALNREYTPLQCVERVFSVELLAEVPTNGRLPIRVVFEVKGVGRWEHELSVFLPSLTLIQRGAR